MCSFFEYNSKWFTRSSTYGLREPQGNRPSALVDLGKGGLVRQCKLFLYAPASKNYAFSFAAISAKLLP